MDQSASPTFADFCGLKIPLGAMQIERRAIGPNEVLLDVLYCGICIPTRCVMNGERRCRLPFFKDAEFPVKRNCENGAATKFKVGDIGGVGCMVNSCDMCENCLADREQNCLAGATFTFRARL
jgi:alcohol dehydrogenase (NADP+)